MERERREEERLKLVVRMDKKIQLARDNQEKEKDKDKDRGRLLGKRSVKNRRSRNNKLKNNVDNRW